MVSLYVVLVHRRLDRVVPDPVSTIARAGVQRSHHVVEVGLVFRAGDVDPTRVTILYGRCALGSQKEASSHRNPHGVSPVCDRFLLGRDLLCDSRDHRAELVLGVPLPVMHLLHHLLLLALDGLLQIKRSKCQGSQKVTGSRQSKVKAVGPEVKAVCVYRRCLTGSESSDRFLTRDAAREALRAHHVRPALAPCQGLCM